MKNKPAHPLDVHIGKLLRLRRKMAGLSQDDLGKKVGVTFQQIQKYENGFNSLNAPRLYDIAKVLGVTPVYFYQGYGFDDNSVELNSLSAQAIHLVQDFSKISSIKLRNTIAAFVREMAKGACDGI